jgi:hypothetical protein
MTVLSTITVSYTHSVTYVASKMLASMKDIIRDIGLNPSHLVKLWTTYEHGLTIWLSGRHVEGMILEVFDQATDKLITRWDIDVEYEPFEEEIFWADTAEVKREIERTGRVPSSCQYRILVSTGPNAPDIPGWTRVPLRSTDGLTRNVLGATVRATGISGSTAHWR